MLRKHHLIVYRAYYVSSLILLTLMFAFTSSTLAKSNCSGELSRRMTLLLEQDVLKYNIPGAVLSIKLPNHPIQTYTVGLADIAKKQPITKNTLFLVGSITKSFTASIILKLQEDGKLNINQTLSQVARPNTKLYKLIKEYPILSNLSVKVLLNHSSGLPATTNTEAFEKKFHDQPYHLWSRAELLRLALNQKSFFIAGSKGKYHYTNTDYLLVGLVIESITGKPVDQAMYTMFEYAKLPNKDIYYPIPGQKIPTAITKRLPQSYMPSDSGWSSLWMTTFEKYPMVTIPGPKQLTAFNISELDMIFYQYTSTAGSIITNAPTLVKWYDALFNRHILSDASITNMQTTIPTGGDFRYGLGITTGKLTMYNQTYISHDGSMLGDSANIIILKPSNIIIAITTNSVNSAIEINSNLMNDVFNALKLSGCF